LLESQLALADPTEGRVKIEDKPFILFRGSHDRVEFISNYSLADGPGDFRKIGYQFDGHAFRYEEKSLFGYVPSVDEQVNGEPIATLRSMSFRFLRRNNNVDPMDTSWVDEWKYGDGFPVAVEVHIENDAIVIPLANRT